MAVEDAPGGAAGLWQMALEMRLHALVGVRCTGVDDANAVISERRVHVGNDDARHVAVDAIFPADGTSFAWML
jgi:hypothetical protein